MGAARGVGSGSVRDGTNRRTDPAGVRQYHGHTTTLPSGAPPKPGAAASSVRPLPVSLSVVANPSQHCSPPFVFLTLLFSEVGDQRVPSEGRFGVGPGWDEWKTLPRDSLTTPRARRPCLWVTLQDPGPFPFPPALKPPVHSLPITLSNSVHAP